ncbi:MAG TPA: helix-turn-helix domain-containing protein [Thermoleophilaceae bacterium]|nr:helix-turn-helix domain-containing protein [Thermoleophilaceae bacterium]
MKRKYELKKRAEAQLETRRRIVEAAVSLHASKGPAHTSLSEVARVAGVQRHTLYRHFPEERDLMLACSGLYTERHPLPDPARWAGLQGEEQLRVGLREMYAFFESNEPMMSRLVVDAETHALTREMIQMRRGAELGRIRQTLARALPRRAAAQAALDLALDFRTWQRLRRSGLSSRAAADAMARALLAQ